MLLKLNAHTVHSVIIIIFSLKYLFHKYFTRIVTRRAQLWMWRLTWTQA